MLCDQTSGPLEDEVGDRADLEVELVRERLDQQIPHAGVVNAWCTICDSPGGSGVPVEAERSIHRNEDIPDLPAVVYDKHASHVCGVSYQPLPNTHDLDPAPDVHRVLPGTVFALKFTDSGIEPQFGECSLDDA